MIRLLVLVALIAGCLGQEIAKQKCAEYIARAKEHAGPQCGPLISNKCLANGGGKKCGVVVPDPKQYPANVLLGYQRKENLHFSCSGVVISEDTILVAGHCISKEYIPTVIRLGNESVYSSDVGIKEVIHHPDYNHNMPRTDLAVIKVKEALPSWLMPACLDTQGLEGVRGLAVGMYLHYAGSEDKNKVVIGNVEFTSTQDCLDGYKNSSRIINYKPEEVLCIQDLTGGPGNCLNGPLYVAQQNCSHTVAGIASVGRSCHSQNADTPSIYVKVFSYLPWIESVTWPSGKL